MDLEGQKQGLMPKSATREELIAALLSLSEKLPLLSGKQLYRAKEAISQADILLNQQRIRWFNPNKAQKRYIDAVGSKDAYIVIFAAGNGVGKTAATIAMIAAMIWPELAPQSVFGSEVFQKWPYPKEIRIVGTPANISVGGSIQREVKTWFPSGRYSAIAAGKPFISQYRAKDWTISLMSFDQDIQAHESATCGLIVFDEPPPKDIFNASAARMRRGGRILFPNTPLMGAAWMMDDLVSKADGKSILVVSGDIDEALEENGGILKKSDVERMLSNYDPDELEARKSGKFMHLSGRIFKSFNRDIHVSKTNLSPLPDCSIYHVVDPAVGKPVASILAYVDATGAIHIYDEWPEFEFNGAKDTNMSVDDYVQLFKSKEEGKEVAWRILDRHFGNTRRALGGVSLKQEFADRGIFFQDSYSTADISSEVETGILAVKGYLSFDKTKAVDSLNRPRLIISPNCHNTIASLEKWSRDAKSGKPKEEYKDFADCVRYLCAANPSVYKAAEWDTNEGQPYYGVNTGEQNVS